MNLSRLWNPFPTPPNHSSVHPMTLTSPATRVNPGTVDDQPEDKCHRCVYGTFCCMGGTGTAITTGFSAWSFAATTKATVIPHYVAAGAFGYAAVVGALGTLAFYKYASVRDMDAIVVALGGTAMKFEDDANAIKLLKDDFAAKEETFNQQVAELKNTITSYENSTKVLTGDVTQIKDKIDAMVNANKVLTTEVDRLTILKKSQENMINDFAKTSANYAKIVEKYQQASNELAQAENKLKDALQAEKTNSDALAALQKDISEKNHNLQETMGSFQTVFKSVSEHAKQIQDLMAELNKLDEPYLDLISKLKRVVQELDTQIAERTAKLKIL